MGGYPVGDSQMQYGIMSAQTRAVEDLSNPNDSTIGNKLQSQYSQNEAPNMG